MTLSVLFAYVPFCTCLIYIHMHIFIYLFIYLLVYSFNMYYLDSPYVYKNTCMCKWFISWFITAVVD